MILELFSRFARRSSAVRSRLQVTMDRYEHLFKSDDQKKAVDTIVMDMFA
jgi:hypothetical protein